MAPRKAPASSATVTVAELAKAVTILAGNFHTTDAGVRAELDDLITRCRPAAETDTTGEED